MMSKYAILAPLFAALAHVPAAADDKKSDVSPSTEKRICRKYEATGTIMPPKRVCHTAAEWAKIDGTNGNDIRRFRDQGTNSPNNSL